jgi:tricorn protease
MQRAIIVTLTILAAAGVAAETPRLSQPAISPDATQIAFVAGGDIWAVSAAGGDARLLVAHPADETRPLFSPDGTKLAFESTRSGNGDIYVLDLGNASLRRLTFDDATESLDAWSHDGRAIYFSSSTDDIAAMRDVFVVPVSGGTPMPVSAERYTNEYFAAPSPDGATLALNARGISSFQWWRNGHSHIDEAEIWLLRDGAYRRLVDRGATSLWPMWSADGSAIFYMSDRSGTENLWASSLEGGARQLTSFESGRVLWPTISRKGDTIVFEHDFSIWRFDAASGRASRLEIALRGAPAAPVPSFAKNAGDVTELAVSPDGKKVAFVVRGEVFAASAADGGEALRVTRTDREELGLAWTPDSRSIVYASARDGGAALFRYDFTKNAEERLTEDTGIDYGARVAPDGKSVAFIHDGTEIRVLDLATKKSRTIASGIIDRVPPLNWSRSFAWSPDSSSIAFLAQGDRLFRNAHVVNVNDPAAKPVQVSWLPNVFASSIDWSPDASAIFVGTGQRTEDGQVARIDLVPRTPQFREKKFRDLFEEEKKKDDKADAKADAKKDVKVEVDLHGIRRRLELLPVSLDVDSVTVSPDGKKLLLVASAEGRNNLYLYSIDELDEDKGVPVQLTSTTGSKSSAQFSGDSQKVWFIEKGAINSVAVDDKKVSKLSVSAPMEIDFARDRRVLFEQAWSWLARHFHDPKMNGADWNAVREAFLPRVMATRTPDELYALLRLMVGELDASHLGINPPGNSERTTGRLGLRFDPAAYAESGMLKIEGLVPGGPAAVSRSVKPGDYLVAIDGRKIGRDDALEALMENRIGREVKLTLASDPAGAKTREVTVMPVNQGAHKSLLYDEWIEKNRAYVDTLSGGRLGYVHMQSMGYDSFLRLVAELDADNMNRDGVVFDIRNNNGGFVHAYALDILSREHYLEMTFRGWPKGNARTILGQRSLEKPTVLLTNQHSLSDAEDFAEGYRAMKLGEIVGEPTSGWIIYTSNVTMIDGSSVRLPFITVTTAAGEPMEMAPRPVDHEVRRTLGEDVAGRDSQLEKAVEILLRKLGPT